MAMPASLLTHITANKVGEINIHEGESSLVQLADHPCSKRETVLSIAELKHQVCHSQMSPAEWTYSRFSKSVLRDFSHIVSLTCPFTVDSKPVTRKHIKVSCRKANHNTDRPSQSEMIFPLFL
jgi:hypothetical protein